MHFFVAHKRTVHANRQTRSAGHVEHVAHAQQRFGTHLVQDGAAVNLAADLEGDTGWDVGLDQAGDHIHAGPLGRQNQVDAGGARFLRQAGNQLLNLLAHHHHQVGQLVDHHHDVRQALQRLRVVGGEAERVGDELARSGGFVNLGVKPGQVAHAHFAHELVALFHLSHAPVQAMGGLAHIGNHGCQQVRDAFVHRHLQHLGVNHQQAHIARLGLVQQAQNHGVDTHRFTRTGGSSHQHMRHLRQIGHDRVAHNVFAQAHGQHGLAFVVNLRTQNL